MLSLYGYIIGITTAGLTLFLALDPNLILNLATLALVIAGAFAAYKYGTATMLRQSNADLKERAAGQEKEIRGLRQEVALLRQKTDLEPIAAAVVLQFEKHESRAAERHAAALRIMDLIAKRLGPEE